MYSNELGKWPRRIRIGSGLRMERLENENWWVDTIGDGEIWLFKKKDMCDVAELFGGASGGIRIGIKEYSYVKQGWKLSKHRDFNQRCEIIWEYRTE